MQNQKLLNNSNFKNNQNYILTKKEKEEIRQKAKKGDRSLTNFIIKFLYDHGALTSEK